MRHNIRMSHSFSDVARSRRCPKEQWLSDKNWALHIPPSGGCAGSKRFYHSRNEVAGDRIPLVVLFCGPADFIGVQSYPGRDCFALSPCL